MGPFSTLEAIPGIHFEGRFPLFGLRAAPLRGVLVGLAQNTSYSLDLTYGHPCRHFLALWRDNREGAGPQLPGPRSHLRSGARLSRIPGVDAAR